MLQCEICRKGLGEIVKDRGCLANNLDFAIIKIESIGLKIFNLKIWGRKMENYIPLLMKMGIRHVIQVPEKHLRKVRILKIANGLLTN